MMLDSHYVISLRNFCSFAHLYHQYCCCPAVAKLSTAAQKLGSSWATAGQHLGHDSDEKYNYRPPE